MNKESLLERKASVEQRFQDLNRQRNELDSEIIRLQGEYRVLDDLITNATTDTPPTINNDVPLRKPKRLRKVIEVDAQSNS